jgi:hypothetical protein
MHIAQHSTGINRNGGDSLFMSASHPLSRTWKEAFMVVDTSLLIDKTNITLFFRRLFCLYSFNSFSEWSAKNPPGNPTASRNDFHFLCKKQDKSSQMWEIYSLLSFYNRLGRVLRWKVTFLERKHMRWREPICNVDIVHKKRLNCSSFT